MSDNQLQVLKRYYPALRNLRKDLSHNIIPMQLYKGMMGTLTRTYETLHANIAAAVDDPFVNALRLEVPEDANDKIVAAQISLLVGQLLAYVEGTIEYLKTEEEKREEEPEHGSVQRFNQFMDKNGE